MKPTRSNLAVVLAFACASVAAGCSMHPEARVTLPVLMSPMADATLRAELGRVLVSRSVTLAGWNENSSLYVVLRVTNGGPEPYTLNTGSIACWLELSPDRPEETRAVAPVGGGAGVVPNSGTNLGSVTILPGETREAWVHFRGYRYAGNDVPRKVTIWFPDARGRRVELVIADPGRGQRWMVKPLAFGWAFGAESTTLDSSAFVARSVAAQLTWVFRMGPLLADAGMSDRLILERGGRLISETSGFDAFGVHAHIAAPLVRLDVVPLRLGLYGGGEAQYFNEINRPDSNGAARGTYSALSAEGGVELDTSGSSPAPSPLPISFSQPSLPGVTLRAGYTYWWTRGDDVSANSGGFVFTLRFAFL